MTRHLNKITILILLLVLLANVAKGQRDQKDYRIYRGDEVDLSFSVRGDYTSHALLFSLKASKTPTASRITQKDTTSGIVATYSNPFTVITITLDKEDTQDLTSSIYYYDVEATISSDTTFKKTLAYGTVNMIFDVTTPYDGTDSLTSNGVRMIGVDASSFDSGEFVKYNGSTFIGDSLNDYSTYDSTNALIEDSLSNVVRNNKTNVLTEDGNLAIYGFAYFFDDSVYFSNGATFGTPSNFVASPYHVRVGNKGLYSEGNLYGAASTDSIKTFTYAGQQIDWAYLPDIKGAINDSLQANITYATNGELNDIVRVDVSNGDTLFSFTSPSEYWEYLADQIDTVESGVWNGSEITNAYIADDITASNYLPLSGGTLTGALTGTSADFTGAITNDTGELQMRSSDAGAYDGQFDALYTSTLNTTGDVGIGTASPNPAGVKLDVEGSIEAGVTSDAISAISIKASGSQTLLAALNNSGSALNMFNLNSTDGNFSKLAFYNSNSLVDAAIVGVHKSHTNRTGELAFLTHTGVGFTEKMRIDSDGNVGIGTTSPSTNLEVVGSSVSDGIILSRSGTSRIKAFGDGTLYWGASADQGRLTWGSGYASVLALSGNDLIFGADESIDMTILENGNVGIGTASPTVELDVVGDGAFSGDLDVSGTIDAASLDFTDVTTDSTTVSAGYVFIHNGIVRVKK